MVANVKTKIRAKRRRSARDIYVDRELAKAPPMTDAQRRAAVRAMSRARRG
jgi:hypothetical protein